jgi:HK97 family phage major capsid protein
MSVGAIFEESIPMTDKTVHYSGGVVAASDGVRYDTAARLKAISEAGDGVYKAFNSGEIDIKGFDASMVRLENDAESVRQEQRNAKAVRKWAGSADSSIANLPRNPQVKAFGRSPNVVPDDAQCSLMYQKAMSGESVIMKDFNDSVSAQIPPQLASWITEAIHEKRLLDRLPSTATEAPSFRIARHVSTTGDAAIVQEGAVKPEVKLNLDHVDLVMRKLACHSAESWEVLQDLDVFTRYLQQELPRRLIEMETHFLLYGRGDSFNELLGFWSTPNVLLHDCTPSAMAASATAYLDDIEESIEQLRSGPSLAEPNLFVTSPSTWSAIRRIKDDLHRFILSPDPSQDEVNSIWGVPVLVTTKAVPGDGFLIDTSKFGRAIIREGLSVRQGTDSDDFTKNLLRWVWEERLNLAVERPSAVLLLSALPVTAGNGS